MVMGGGGGWGGMAQGHENDTKETLLYNIELPAYILCVDVECHQRKLY